MFKSYGQKLTHNETLFKKKQSSYKWPVYQVDHVIDSALLPVGRKDRRRITLAINLCHS